VIVRRKIVGGVLAAVAASGLMFAGSAPAAADVVAPHKHCLLTPNGWVLIAEGVTDEAPNLALVEFHYDVHTGVPGWGLDAAPNTGDEIVRIERIGANQDCSSLLIPAV